MAGLAGPPITLYGVDAHRSRPLIRRQPPPTVRDVAQLGREQILGIFIANGIHDERIRNSKSKRNLFKPAFKDSENFSIVVFKFKKVVNLTIFFNFLHLNSQENQRWWKDCTNWSRREEQRWQIPRLRTWRKHTSRLPTLFLDQKTAVFAMSTSACTCSPTAATCASAAPARLSFWSSATHHPHITCGALDSSSPAMWPALCAGAHTLRTSSCALFTTPKPWFWEIILLSYFTFYIP